MTEREKAHLSAIVHGRVQGVGYRFFAQRWAHQLNLTGYVRNRCDGTVEVLAEGDKGELETFLSQLRIGPRGAWVDKVDHQWLPFSGRFGSFEVRY